MRFYILLSLLLLLLTSCGQNSHSTISYLLDKETFRHGVASGDPTSESVIIWTRVSGVDNPSEVSWQVSEDSTFRAVKNLETSTISSDRDYTVKINVQGLQPNTHYYYRFLFGDKASPTGRTKTLSQTGREAVKLGIVSCSNYEFGYFGAYHGLAEENLDAVLHLGDYIYEYGPDKYGDTSFTRKHLPAKEIISLSDYRTRYAQYREDEGLQHVHQMHPFITIWDDHEISNNSYKDGAQNHQEDEGDYADRKAIAKQVYYEWMPIREQTSGHLYRKFHMGEMADVIMLDERLVGREAPPDSHEERESDRSMLGEEQLAWFQSSLSNSTSKWKIIGNQVIFSPCDLSVIRPQDPYNLDAWDGYAQERDAIRSHITSGAIDNVIFVTGDTHSSWAFDIPPIESNYIEDNKSCAVEIGTTSITSSNWNERAEVSDAQVKEAEQALIHTNPHLKYVNGRDHGYTILTLSDDGAQAEWFYLDDLKSKRPNITKAHEVSISNNSITQ